MSSERKNERDDEPERRPPKRRISFDPDEPMVVEVERVAPEMKAELFYNKRDIAQFQADEKRRFDRMMMKKIQRLVGKCFLA
jgi:hypothetical protein